MRTSNMLVNSSRKPSWQHLEWDWIKNGRKRWESWLKKGCQNALTKKLQKLHWKHTFFDEVAYLQYYTHPYIFLSLPVDKVQKNGRKRRLFEWVLVVFACKRRPKKSWKFWQTTYLRAPKSSWNFSTINQKPSLVCDKHGLRKEKSKRTLLSFQAVVTSTYLVASTTIKMWLLPQQVQLMTTAVLCPKTQSDTWGQAMCLSLPCKRLLETTRNGSELKNRRRRWEYGLKIGCQNVPKNAKTALKTYLFLWGHMLCKVASMLIACFHCLLTMHKRMAEKGEFLGEFWLSLHANDNQQTIVKFDNQNYLWSSKGLETSQRSTRNLALCVISMGWEKKKKTL